MNTPRTMEELFANDENVKKVINRFVSMRVDRIGSILSREDRRLSLIVNDVAEREGLSREKCEEMTYGELVRLLESEKNRLLSRAGYENGRMYDDYLLYSELLSGIINQISRTNNDIALFLMIPVGRFMDVLYEERKEKRMRRMFELKLNYTKSDKYEEGDFSEDIPIGRLISKTTLCMKAWTPGVFSIEEYRRRRKDTCRIGGRILIECITEGLWDKYDNQEIRRKYNGLCETEEFEENETEKTEDKMKGE